MAKKRQQPKSAFENTSKEELKNVGKEILKKAAHNEKPEVADSTTADNETTKARDKYIYVTPATHRLAKRQAVLKDMTLKEYVTYLIEKDSD